MGETADQIRDQVDQAREQATDKILQLEQQVTDAAGHVKEQLDWRHQVEERPLVALGVALVGGMVFGSMTSGNGHASRQSTASGAAGLSAGGGLGGIIRKAATNSGIETKVETYAHDLFASLSKRIGEVASDAFSSTSEKPSVSPESSASPAHISPLS